MRGNSFTKNGQLGLTSHKGHGLVGEGNRFAENNYERFAISYQAGAVKLSNTTDSVWRNNLFEWNYGKGLWLDRACYNVKVVGNTIRHNQALGISLEISSKLLVASNVITDNGTFGIHVNESRDVDIYNNTLDGNERAIRVWEGKRSQDVADVIVKNNILSRSSEASFTADDWDRRRSAEKMGVTSNYNGYYRPRTSSPAVLIRWSRWPTKVLDLKSLSAFRSATTQGDNSREWGNVSDPFFVDAAGEDYRLRLTSAARGIGSPLPSAVASAIGVAAGVKVDLGALRW
ncbi:MAG: right-handed parallel beta-helix repeat-containing protein [Nocardioidaceae bacterium]|nr:right-handed parallel beta-helix repeat-containing protein [Nocardioidaceae bacterium]